MSLSVSYSTSESELEGKLNTGQISLGRIKDKNNALSGIKEEIKKKNHLEVTFFFSSEEKIQETWGCWCSLQR